MCIYMYILVYLCMYKIYKFPGLTRWFNSNPFFWTGFLQPRTVLYKAKVHSQNIFTLFQTTANCHYVQTLSAYVKFLLFSFLLQVREFSTQTFRWYDLQWIFSLFINVNLSLRSWSVHVTRAHSIIYVYTI